MKKKTKNIRKKKITKFFFLGIWSRESHNYNFKETQGIPSEVIDAIDRQTDGRQTTGDVRIVIS